MVTYTTQYFYNDTSTSTSSNSCTSSNSWINYKSLTSVKMDYLSDKERKVPKEAVTEKKRDGINSTLFNHMINTIGLSSKSATFLIYGPGNFAKSNIYMKDFNTVSKRGYMTNKHFCDSLEFVKTQMAHSFCTLLLINVLECIPTLMERALILKNLMSKFYYDATGIFLISARTKEDLEKEAEESKYVSQEKGFMVKDFNLKEPTYVEPLDKADILSLLGYIGVKDACIRDNDKENCVAVIVRNSG